MKNRWSKEYTLRAGDFDKYDRIMPSAVLDLFQDAAGQHAIEIGVGFDEMIKRSYLWVLTKIKFKIIFHFRYPFSSYFRFDTSKTSTCSNRFYKIEKK